MDTADFAACVEVQAAALRDFRPDVLVGSSFGGAVAVELLRRGSWRGPTLLLAQAAVKRDPRARLPEGVPVWLVHGLRDDNVHFQNAAWLIDALQEHEKMFDLMVYPRDRHGIGHGRRHFRRMRLNYILEHL